MLPLLGRGWDNARIGRELLLSLHTVRIHLQNLLEKLEMHATQEAAAFEQPDASRILVALQQLPPDQREVLLLRMAAGLTAPEVAAALHMTTGAVKALQHRGLASLAVVLGSDLDDAAARLRAGLRRPPPPQHADPTPGHQEGQAHRPN